MYIHTHIYIYIYTHLNMDLSRYIYAYIHITHLGANRYRTPLHIETGPGTSSLAGEGCAVVSADLLHQLQEAAWPRKAAAPSDGSFGDLHLYDGWF